MTVSVSHSERQFSKQAYFMQMLFAAVSVLMLSLSLDMGAEALFAAAACAVTAFAGLSKKTLPLPLVLTAAAGAIFHESFVSSLSGFVNAFAAAYGKSAGRVTMLLENGSEPIFALCAAAVIVTTVQAVFCRLNSRVFSVAILVLFVLSGFLVDIPAAYGACEAFLALAVFSKGIKGFVLLLTALAAALTACFTGLADKLSHTAFADRFNSRSEYEIVMEHPQPLYLIESRFEKEKDGVWSALDGEEKYACSDEFYWLGKLGFSPAFQTERLDKALEISDNEIVTVNIKNGGRPLLTYGMTDGENVKTDQNVIGESFENTESWYKLSVSESYLSKPFGTYEKLRSGETDGYLSAEKGYRDYVYSTCLEISAEDKQLAANHFDLEGSQGKLRSDMLSFFTSGAVLDRSEKYGGENSFADLLEVTCRGGEEDFAAAVVKIFRAKGVPARLCRGYLITDSMTNGLADNSAVSVTAKQLHYWAEYYKDGIGWQPFEVCPDYIGMIKTDDSSVQARSDSEGGEALAPKDEDKPQEEIFEENKTQPRKNNSGVYVKIGLAILLAVCLAVSIFIWVKRRKFHSLPDREKIQRYFIKGRKKLWDKSLSDPAPEQLAACIRKRCGEDMAESFVKCEKIYEKARFSRLPVTAEELETAKDFVKKAAKAKKR